MTPEYPPTLEIDLYRLETEFVLVNKDSTIKTNPSTAGTIVLVVDNKVYVQRKFAGGKKSFVETIVSKELVEINPQLFIPLS